MEMFYLLFLVLDFNVINYIILPCCCYIVCILLVIMGTTVVSKGAFLRY